jgi:hypothetical protein
MSIEAMKQTFDFLHDLWEMKQTAKSDQHKKVMWELDRVIGKAEKQEPVGFVHPEAIPRLKDAPSDWMVIYGRSQHPHNFPLYTAPPQREWVGLTDEEALDVWGKVELGQTEEHGVLLLYKAFETKLKDKNA